MSEGTTDLFIDRNGKPDILFRDASGEKKSTLDEGGEVLLIRSTPTEVTVAVLYREEAKVMEIYSFVHEKSGRVKMLQLTNRGVDGALAVPKAAVYVADCRSFNALPPGTANTSG